MEGVLAAYDKAREKLGFRPTIHLERGLAEVWDWLQANRADALAIGETGA